MLLRVHTPRCWSVGARARRLVEGRACALTLQRSGCRGGAAGGGPSPKTAANARGGMCPARTKGCASMASVFFRGPRVAADARGRPWHCCSLSAIQPESGRNAYWQIICGWHALHTVSDLFLCSSAAVIPLTRAVDFKFEQSLSAPSHPRHGCPAVPLACPKHPGSCWTPCTMALSSQQLALGAIGEFLAVVACLCPRRIPHPALTERLYALCCFWSPAVSVSHERPHFSSSVTLLRKFPIRHGRAVKHG